MDFKKLIAEQEFSDFPIGIGGCKNSDISFDICPIDVCVFDGKNETDKIIQYDGKPLVIHHVSLSEKKSENLLKFDKLQIIQDESWELRMLLSKINEKRSLLFTDFAKNCLIESQFCCQKTKEAIESSNAFAPCWQKCASYYLADAISAINHLQSRPSHMLESLRKLAKNNINEHISIVTQTVGIERAIPSLLERMLKSTIGFSDLVEKNDHSKIIQAKHDYFLKNSMLSDCYFYLGYINKENFVKVKDALNREPDLIYILKIAFDVEADSNLLLQHANLVQKSSNDILEIISKK
ncbi:DNA ligase-like domain-containing protein [Nitrosopumilus sp. S4]